MPPFVQVSDWLRMYVSAGVQGQSDRFSPKGQPLALYIHGTAGSGKSSFVKVFRAALQRLMQRSLDPHMQVRGGSGPCADFDCSQGFGWSMSTHWDALCDVPCGVICEGTCAAPQRRAAYRGARFGWFSHAVWQSRGGGGAAGPRPRMRPSPPQSFER